MGIGSKCSILNGQVVYLKKSKLNIADMWPIPLDRVTYERDKTQQDISFWDKKLKHLEET